MFSNLLRNAVVHNPSTPPEIHVAVVQEDATATVRITDNGPGIPDHVHDHHGQPPRTDSQE
ncbi:ATP-binding protein, partial [Klebsiella quasipneumoniae]|uniref:ATP-binding protein n=1 Tax=Klebsiella quasipneumoniae TaxID=1463165 RepID=UPI0034DB0996